MKLIKDTSKISYIYWCLTKPMEFNGLEQHTFMSWALCRPHLGPLLQASHRRRQAVGRGSVLIWDLGGNLLAGWLTWQLVGFVLLWVVRGQKPKSLVTWVSSTCQLHQSQHEWQSARRMDGTIFVAQSTAISSQYCHILLVRSKAGAQSLFTERGHYKSVDIKKQDHWGPLLEAAYNKCIFIRSILQPSLETKLHIKVMVAFVLNKLDI